MLDIDRLFAVPCAGGQKGRALVRQALRQASHMGLNVMRVFAHTTDPNFPLQTAPGVYNEKVFKALDFVLVEVSRREHSTIRQCLTGCVCPGSRVLLAFCHEATYCLYGEVSTRL